MTVPDVPPRLADVDDGRWRSVDDVDGRTEVSDGSATGSDGSSFFYQTIVNERPRLD